MKNIFILTLLFFITESAFCQVIKSKTESKKPIISVTSQTKIPKRVSNLPVVYTFIGNGNWDNPANWENQEVPSDNIPPGSEIRINSLISNAKCILNVPFEIPNTTNTIKLIVYTGNQLVVPDLIVK